MNWIDIVWPMIGAISLTMGLFHLLIWSKRRSETVYLLFGMVALLVATVSVLELIAMRQHSASAYAQLLRWGHVPFAGAMLCLILFVDRRFDAGSRWLFHGAWLSRGVALLANFTTGANLNFQSVASLGRADILGSPIATPIGEPNSWMVTGQLAQLILLAYMVSIILDVWRRGDPAQLRSALLVCGSVITFVLASNLVIVLLVLELAQAPIMVSTLFLLVVLASSYELGGEVIRAGLLSRKLSDSQRSLGESERRLKLAANAGQLGLWSWDVDGNDSWVSETGYALLGLAPGDAIGWQGLLDLAHAEDRPALHAARTVALQTGEFTCEYRLGDVDGGERWLAASGRLDDHIPGTPRILRGVLVDISQRKLADLQREELAHLSRVALLGEMSSTIAHELNQPLTAVLSNAQAAERFLVSNPPDLVEVRDCLVDVIDNTRRAGDVIRRVRDMLRKDTVKHEPMDLNEVIQDALHLMAGDLRRRDVAVRLALAPGLARVSGDPVQIKQVLLNLVLNAADALAARPSDRIISVCSRPGPASVEILVSDNGPGIAPDQLEKIFTAFVTSKASGIGLGLAICRTIVQAHGGTLRAHNTNDGGACLQLRLPVAGSLAN
jgi:two-component system, LuxR family, sensor kinase FixL